MFDRLEKLVGKDLSKIQNLTVLVIGLGGVGSYAVESLVRSGVGHLVLIDHDVVDLTNLNRQLMTLQSNIGKKKTEVWKERIYDINPECIVEDIPMFVTKENMEDLFQQPIDYVVDACDTIETKKEVIKYCLDHKIKFISSMGTAQKLDPTKLTITTLDKTSYDPLAKKLRKMLKEEHIYGKVPVISSIEIPRKMNGKTLGSCAFVPSVAGLLCTSYIINDCLEETHEDN